MATAARPAALVYCRISRDRAGGGLGVERQERECRALAERLGVHVAEVYSDNDISAYSGKPRPGYRRLCADLEAGRARTVLVWHTDRLHRSPAELEAWINLADPRGVVVQTVQSGELDLATPSGRVSARVLGAVARGESEHKAARLRSQKDQARTAGRWLGGRRPFGYGPDGVTLWSVDPDGGPDGDGLPPLVAGSEADMIRTGTAAVLSGGSLRSVVRAWNATGTRTITGRAWTLKAVRDVLHRGRNAGLHEHDGVLGEGAEWSRIVTPDQLRAVRAVLDGNDAEHAEANRWGNRARWLLSGIACCPCGAPLRAITGTKRPRVYRCTAYTRGPGTAAGGGHVTRLAEPIDVLVDDVMTARLGRGDIAELLRAAAEPSVDVVALRAQRKAARTRLDEIAAMLGDGDITPDMARAATGKARGRLDAANTALATVERSSPLAGPATADDPVAWWRAADLDDRRALIRTLLRVTVHRQGPGRRPFDPATVEITAAMPGAL